MIRERIEQALHVEALSVRDDSHLHAGHAGARAGGGHFHVHVISNDFRGLSQVAGTGSFITRWVMRCVTIVFMRSAFKPLPLKKLKRFS